MLFVKKAMAQKIAMSSYLLLTLAACGGGFSNDDSDDGNTTPPPTTPPSEQPGTPSPSPPTTNQPPSNGGTAPEIPKPVESGQFISADEGEGAYFPSAPSAHDQFADACADTHNFYYFEFDQVRVYGDANLPESDFRQVAALVIQSRDQALPLMQLNDEQLATYRPFYTPDVAQGVLDVMVQIRNGQFEGVSVDQIAPNFPQPDNWAELDNDEAKYTLTQYWNQASDQEQQAWAAQLIANPLTRDYFSERSPEEHQMPEPLVVCINSDINRHVYGTLYGINMAPPSVVNLNSSTPASVLHAVIHTLQLNVSAPDNGISVADRWFYEGQATLLAGQTVAEAHNTHNPVDVISLDDERSQFGDDVRLAYAHYALAYHYLNTNNEAEDLAQIWLDIRSQQRELVDSDDVSHPLFNAAFDQNLKQQNGDALSLKQYREQYQSLLSM